MIVGEVSVLVLTDDFLCLWYVRKKHSFSTAREDLGISLVWEMTVVIISRSILSSSTVCDSGCILCTTEDWNDEPRLALLFEVCDWYAIGTKF